MVQAAGTLLVGWSLIRLSGYTFIFCLVFVCFVLLVFFLISDMTCSQRSMAHSLQSRGGFLSSFLSQSKKGPSRQAHPGGASPTQSASMLLGKKEPTNHQVILNCGHWKVLHIQGVNLQLSTAPSFYFHLKKSNVLSCLASVCWAWMQHRNSCCCLGACGALASASFLCLFFCFLFCSLAQV